jgi:hypothetical protein
MAYVTDFVAAKAIRHRDVDVAPSSAEHRRK